MQCQESTEQFLRQALVSSAKMDFWETLLDMFKIIKVPSVVSGVIVRTIIASGILHIWYTKSGILTSTMSLDILTVKHIFFPVFILSQMGYQKIARVPTLRGKGKNDIPEVDANALVLP